MSNNINLRYDCECARHDSATINTKAHEETRKSSVTPTPGSSANARRLQIKEVQTSTTPNSPRTTTVQASLYRLSQK